MAFPPIPLRSVPWSSFVVEVSRNNGRKLSSADGIYPEAIPI
jgi:hypothetical protein